MSPYVLLVTAGWLMLAWGFLFGFFLGSDLSLALVPFVGLQLAKLSENLGCGHLGGDLLWLLSELGSWLLNNVLVLVLSFSLGRLELVSSSIWNLTSLVLAFFGWEEDQLALVALKSLNVELKSFF